MFRSVIVPLDGSSPAETAIPYAIDQASRHGATLVLVRVTARPELWPAVPCVSGPVRRTPVWPEEELAAEERQGVAYLATVVRRFGLPADTAVVVPTGNPYLRLAAEVRCRAAPLVVVARSGSEPTATRSRLVRRLLRGRVAPVLAVRDDQPTEAVAPVGVPAWAEARDDVVTSRLAGDVAGSHNLSS